MNLWNIMSKKISEVTQSRKMSDEEYYSEIEIALDEINLCINNKNEFIDPIFEEELKRKYLPIYNKANSFNNSFWSVFNLKIKKPSQLLVEQYENLHERIHQINNNYAVSIIRNIKKDILPVEGKELDEQQLKSIVKDVQTHLILAGAGTGKTTTIVGYIKYLLKIKQVNPEDILVLSFTNNSAKEMAERIEKETGYKLDASTFHKLGMNIISNVENKKPSVYSGNINEFIKRKLNELIKDNTYFKHLCSYLIYYSEDDKSEFEFENEVEYKEYLKINQPTTLKGEKVKSYGEMLIANFLAANGVNYEYESTYKLETSTKKYSQYKPDFYLPDYDIYIEYFGINKEGNVAPYFSGKDGKSASESYRESMQWKRELHSQNNTKMVELYAYQHFDNVLLDELSKKLKSENVVFHPISNEELWHVIGKNKIDSMVELLGTIINLMKSNDCDFDGLLERNNSIKRPLKLNIIIDILKPIYYSYQDELEKLKQIDFNDMINKATKYVEEEKYHHPYKFVIVDEYQDISQSRYKLLKALRNQENYKLFCVGDDWQSIYRFSGSDIGFILSFDKYWGPTEIDKIETTYRFPTSLINLSGSFIMKNPSQIRKSLVSKQDVSFFSCEEIKGYTDRSAVQFMEKKLNDLPKNSTVLFLGRYSFDIKLLGGNDNYDYQYDNSNKKVKVVYKRRKDLDITYMTAHGSKGLQADYVFILNNHDRGMGFPSRISDAPILKLLLDNTEQYPFAEERRLFYVALTRAKKKTYLLIENNNESIFAKEVKKDFGKQMKEEQYTCPECGGKLILKHGQYGDFFGCSNYKINGCKYTRKIERRN